jgi:hypothetical protein
MILGSGHIGATNPTPAQPAGQPIGAERVWEIIKATNILLSHASCGARPSGAGSAQPELPRERGRMIPRLSMLREAEAFGRAVPRVPGGTSDPGGESRQDRRKRGKGPEPNTEKTFCSAQASEMAPMQAYGNMGDFREDSAHHNRGGGWLYTARRGAGRHAVVVPDRSDGALGHGRDRCAYLSVRSCP